MTRHGPDMTRQDITLPYVLSGYIAFYIKGDPHKLPYGTLTAPRKKMLHTSCYKYNNKLYTYKHTLCRHTHTLHPNLRHFHEFSRETLSYGSIFSLELTVWGQICRDQGGKFSTENWDVTSLEMSLEKGFRKRYDNQWHVSLDRCFSVVTLWFSFCVNSCNSFK